jgi:uncharacterized protein
VEEERGGAGLSGGRLTRTLNRVYDAARHSDAARAAAAEGEKRGFDEFRGHKHLLLVTYKKNGEAVPTPMWFGHGGDRLYVRTGLHVPKLARIRNNPRVQVTWCTGRGKPLGPTIEGTARVLGDAEADVAEAALRKNYGWGRRIYKNTVSAIGDFTYIEIVPAAAAAKAVA